MFGAQQTWFLVNGSTVGIHAALMATAHRGDFVIVARNCHIAAYAGLTLSGVSLHTSTMHTPWLWVCDALLCGWLVKVLEQAPRCARCQHRCT